ncbi:MAG: hypothetical protein WCX90_08825 [Thiohalomonadaceae bacterium]
MSCFCLQKKQNILLFFLPGGTQALPYEQSVYCKGMYILLHRALPSAHIHYDITRSL